MQKWKWKTIKTPGMQVIFCNNVRVASVYMMGNKVFIEAEKDPRTGKKWKSMTVAREWLESIQESI